MMEQGLPHFASDPLEDFLSFGPQRSTILWVKEKPHVPSTCIGESTISNISRLCIYNYIYYIRKYA